MEDGKARLLHFKIVVPGWDVLETVFTGFIGDRGLSCFRIEIGYGYRRAGNCGIADVVDSACDSPLGGLRSRLEGGQREDHASCSDRRDGDAPAGDRLPVTRSIEQCDE